MKFGLKAKKEKKETDLVPDNPNKSLLSKETPASESDSPPVDENELFSENTSTFIDLKKLEYQKYPVYVGVARDLTATGEKLYKVVEPSLTKKDEENFALIKKILMQELTIDLNDIKTKKLAEQKLTRKIIQIVKKYDLKVNRKSLPKILYHAVRDFIHLGRIEALMHDSAIEEISCDGANIPIFIYHRDYESIPSNIVFPTHEEIITKSEQIMADAAANQQKLEETIETVQTGEGEIGGCLIATATFGSELAPQVQQLREIRDNTVMSTASGISFMNGFNQLYYSFSPTIADWERENPIFQEAVRAFITPMISSLSIMTLANGNSEVEVLGLGISVIALNLGMYFVAPTLAVFKVHKHFKSRK